MTDPVRNLLERLEDMADGTIGVPLQALLCDAADFVRTALAQAPGAYTASIYFGGPAPKSVLVDGVRYHAPTQERIGGAAICRHNLIAAACNVCRAERALAKVFDAAHDEYAPTQEPVPETPIERRPVEEIARKLARDGCGDNHQPRHRVAGQSRFDDPNLCDHCGELSDDIADALRAERETK